MKLGLSIGNHVNEMKEHSLKGLKRELALREVPHQGLNHSEGTIRVQRDPK